MEEEKKETNKDLFEKELIDLQNKYGINLYAANCVLPNWEVVPLIKMHVTKDANKEDENRNEE